ncbi:MAG TPA: hypothetical protein VJH94_00660 [Candidatus Paceibacterota bacterium]
MSDTVRATVVWSLIGLCLFSILSYSYFVGKSILQAFHKTALTSESSELASRLNTLESEYLTLQNQMTLSRARTLGFVEVTKRHFISRQPLGQILSLRDEL